MTKPTLFGLLIVLICLIAETRSPRVACNLDELCVCNSLTTYTDIECVDRSTKRVFPSLEDNSSFLENLYLNQNIDLKMETIHYRI
jgi:hypothetical protein